MLTTEPTEPDWSEYTCADTVVCPWCGHNHGNDDMHDVTGLDCDQCGKKFRVEINYSVDYSTEKEGDDGKAVPDVPQERELCVEDDPRKKKEEEYYRGR